MSLLRRQPARAECALALDLPSGPLLCRLRLSNRRRTLALRVSEAGEVVVNAPLRLPRDQIESFLRKHADWIAARLDAAREHAFVWRERAPLPYLGGSLCLRIAAGGGAPRREGDALFCGGEAREVTAAVSRWYRGEARALLQARLAFHAARAGLPVPPLRISDARTRWGSLSAKGVVSLNWRLLKAGAAEIDYVICHELAHFRQRNHSPAFWREVEALYPDWREARLALRRNARRYFGF